MMGAFTGSREPSPQAVSALPGFDPERVFVVMGNDYPDAVFATEEAADAYCQRMRAAELERYRRERGRERPAYEHGIYWRTYEFPLLTGDQ